MTEPAEETLCRSQAAVLFADVQGYSRLLAADEPGTFRRLAEAVRLFERVIADYGGRMVQRTGDEIFGIFPDPAPAAQFAAAFLRDLRNESAWQPGQPRLEFRIGIHVGEIAITDGNVYGLNVNIAARLQKLAPAGGVCLSDEARQAVELPETLAVRPMGRQRLRNIDRPVEAYMATLDDQPRALGAPIEFPHLPLIGNGPALAVLPLRNLTADPADAHVCAGLTADIITNLSRFRHLLVIARHSAFHFKVDEAQDLHDVARCLGVHYVMTGTFQRRAERLRLVVQLLDAESGQVLWSDRFDGHLGEIFDFQDEVGSTVAARLAIQVSANERRRLRDQHLPDVSAYGLILRGEELSLDLRRQTVMHARRLFEQASSLDPHYGRSYAALSRTFNYEWRYSWVSDPDASLEQALRLALSAVDSDSYDARGFGELGFAHLYRKEHSASIAAYERAIDLNPNDADIIAEYADTLVYNGAADRALDLLDRAMRLNPYYPDWYLWNVATAYNALRRPEDVIATVHRMRNPSEGTRLLAANYAHLGMMDQAKQAARDLLHAHPEFTISGWATRPPYRDTDALEHYLKGLRDAGLPR